MLIHESETALKQFHSCFSFMSHVRAAEMKQTNLFYFSFISSLFQL